MHRVGSRAARAEPGPVRQAGRPGARPVGSAAIDGRGAADGRRAACGQDAAAGAHAPRAASVPVRERADLDAAGRDARTPRALGPSARAAARLPPDAQRLRRRARPPREGLPRAARHRVGRSFER